MMSKSYLFYFFNSSFKLKCFAGILPKKGNKATCTIVETSVTTKYNQGFPECGGCSAAAGVPDNKADFLM